VNMLDRKLVRELFSAKGLLLAITSIIAVGVACYVSMQSAYYNLAEAKRRYYRQCRMADFWIDLKKAPVTEIHALAELPGVTKIQPRIQFSATVDLEGTIEPINALVLSLPARREGAINDVVMRRGSYFTDRRRNEVIVNDAFARKHGLMPGRKIHLLLNNRRQELFIVGTAISSEFTYLLGPGALMPDPEHFGVFYVKHRYAEEVFDFEGAANQVVGHLGPEVRGRPDRLLQQAETLLESYGVFTATPLRLQASNQYLSNEIAGLAAFATVMPVIFLAVAALVLNVLMTRLARQQRVVVGTLKALGYSNWQVFAHFLKFGSSVGVAGGICGSVTGYLLATGLTNIYQYFFEFPDLRSDYYPHTYAVGLAFSVLCSVAGSLNGARTVLRLQPAEAMRPAPPRRGRKIFLERIVFVWSRLGSAWRMALRGMVRNRLRTAAGLFAAAMGTALLVSGLMMHEAGRFLIDFQFYRVVRSDIDLMLKDERGEDALWELRRLPGVDLVEPQLDVACTFVNGPYRRKGGITGLAPGAQLTVPRDVEGEALRVPAVGLLLSRRLAEILHVKPGDTITIEPVKGERRPLEVPVAGIANGYMGMAVYADIHYLSRLRNEEFAMSGAQLLTDRDPHSQVELYRELKRLPALQSIVARCDMIELVNDTLIKHQWVFIGTLVLFAGVIFFGSIVNASLVSLAERQREVATLAALGYGQWEIGAMFLRESMLTNMIGTLFGLPIGFLLTVLTAYAYNNDLVRLPIVTKPSIWITTLSLSVAFALLAHGVVQWRIRHLDVLEALKVKE